MVLNFVLTPNVIQKIEQEYYSLKFVETKSASSTHARSLKTCLPADYYLGLEKNTNGIL